MARINNTAAYAISSPVTADDIVIGSDGGNGGDTKNFQMSDIATYVMSVNTLTLQDVCDNGSATTTGITVAGTTTLNGTVDINNTADISGNTTIGGTTTLNGTVDINNTADISDTLTLSSPSGIGLSLPSSNISVGGSTFISSTAVVADGFQTNTTSFTATASAVQCSFGATFSAFDSTLGGTFRLIGSVPSSSTDTGSAGQIAVDATHIYVCVGTDSWGRVAIDTTPF